MSNEVFSVYHCKSCNKIEVTQYISPQQMEEFGLTAEELLPDRKSTRLNSSHSQQSRMPSSA